MVELRSGTPVITIGAMKCGTSSLHRYLALHPDVAMSRVKELDYFVASKNWSKGESWYARQFPAGGRAWGESSPNYTKAPTFPGVPERIHARLPDARLIYVARDPVRRTISHYRHNLGHGRERRPVDEALAQPDDNPYVWPSRYRTQIDGYLAYFRREQVLLLDLDELAAEPARIMRQVFAFVGVDPSFEDPRMGEVHHRTEAKRVPNRFGRVLESVPEGWWLREKLGPLAGRPLPSVRASEATMAALRAVLRPEAEGYRALSGLGLRGWETLADDTGEGA